jgi:hypothetical protein
MIYLYETPDLLAVFTIGQHGHRVLNHCNPYKFSLPAYYSFLRSNNGSGNWVVWKVCWADLLTSTIRNVNYEATLVTWPHFINTEINSAHLSRLLNENGTNHQRSKVFTEPLNRLRVTKQIYGGEEHVNFEIHSCVESSASEGMSPLSQVRQPCELSHSRKCCAAQFGVFVIPERQWRNLTRRVNCLSLDRHLHLRRKTCIFYMENIHCAELAYVHIIFS